MTAPRTVAYPAVQGHCPACQATSLYLGAGGYVTCDRADCPSPDAAAALLAGESAAERQLAELRASCRSLTAHGFDSLSAHWVLELLDSATAEATEPEPQPLTVRYRNWRGETTDRAIVPIRVWYGATEWHPEPQWLLRALTSTRERSGTSPSPTCSPSPQPRPSAASSAPSSSTSSTTLIMRGSTSGNPNSPNPA